MTLVEDLKTTVGTSAACAVLRVPRASFYRGRRGRVKPPASRRGAPRALSTVERETVLQTLNCDAFADLAPAQVFASLLDQGRYLCSVRTMYRTLTASKSVRERRNQLRHPVYTKPELLATAPNQVWSWDITKLLGPQKWTYFHLYVLLDIFSRYTIGWLVATRESAELAKRLIQDGCARQRVDPGQLTIHADRGTSMTSKPVALLLADLGVTKSHSRPQVSNDNPFSEAQFKTMKYRPDFPERFGSLEDVRSFCRGFFGWYNHAHHHSALALLTPAVVHAGRADAVCASRDVVLAAAYAAHPERFARTKPIALRPPKAAWINPPAPEKNTPINHLGPVPQLQ